MKMIITYVAAIVLLAFGMLTFFLSASIILDLFEVREGQGNYVLLIVWTNLIVSLLYLAAAYGFYKQKSFTTNVLGLASALLVLAFIYLGYHIYSGGAYEAKTVAAMVFRTLVTFAFTFAAYDIFKIRKAEPQ